jgi:hypothetical protein
MVGKYISEARRSRGLMPCVILSALPQPGFRSGSSLGYIGFATLLRLWRAVLADHCGRAPPVGRIRPPAAQSS